MSFGFYEDNMKEEKNENVESVYDAEQRLDIRIDRTKGAKGLVVQGVRDREDREIIIPPTAYDQPIRRIGIGAFKESKAEVAIISRGVKEIGESSFEYCSNLREISLPAGVNKLGDRAFRCCRQLERVTLSKGLTALPFSLFEGCEHLTKINIPEKVAEIGRSAFFRCGRLTEIYIPQSVKKIDSFAFAGCPSLTTVYYEGDEDDWKSIRISSANDDLLRAERKFGCKIAGDTYVEAFNTKSV